MTDDEKARALMIDSIPKLAAWLHEKHDLAVGEDDPALLIFTIMQVGLWRCDDMLDRHEEAIAKTFRKASQVFVDDIKRNLEELRNKALSAGLENKVEAMQEQVKLAEKTTRQFQKLVRRVSILSVLNLLAALLTLAVWFFVFK